MPLVTNLNVIELKKYLRLDEFDASEDSILALFLDVAIGEAQAFLGTDFSTTDEEGETITNPAPKEVVLWLQIRVGQLYEQRANPPKPNYSILKNYRVLNEVVVE